VREREREREREERDLPAGEYNAHPDKAMTIPAVAATELEDPRKTALSASVMYLVQFPSTSNCRRRILEAEISRVYGGCRNEKQKQAVDA
jgi:hypothetical protein